MKPINNNVKLARAYWFLMMRLCLMASSWPTITQLHAAWNRQITVKIMMGLSWSIHSKVLKKCDVMKYWTDTTKPLRGIHFVKEKRNDGKYVLLFKKATVSSVSQKPVLYFTFAGISSFCNNCFDHYFTTTPRLLWRKMLL